MARQKPIIFSVLGGIHVTENLGRGDRIDDTIFITNDLTAKEQLVTPFLKSTIGAFEYDSIFTDSSLLAYCLPTSVKSGNEHKFSQSFLHHLIHFAKWTWLYRDHAIKVGNGFMWANDRIYINYPEGRIWRSDGSEETLSISRNELRQLRTRHRHVWEDFDVSRVHAVPVKERSTRIARAFHYVTNAMFSSTPIDKIVHYCSALEALFATSHSELVHLLAERTALVVSNDASERLLTYRRIRDCYRLRSSYTHGAALKQTQIDGTKNTSQGLDTIVRICLTRALNDDELFAAFDSDESLDTLFLKKLFS